jgi:hypothetical protein
MYITLHLHVVKDLWNFLIVFNRFLVFKIFKIQKFQIVSVFWMWVIMNIILTNIIKISLLKDFLA